MGDGWELALRADGRTATFGYDSPLWTNGELLNANVSVGASDAKLAPYLYQPGNELLVRLSAPGGQRGSELRLAVPPFASLRALFQGGFVATNALRADWIALVPGGASHQPNCNAQGINLQVGNFPPSQFYVRYRIGFAANNQYDCDSPDTTVGVGAHIAVNYCGAYDAYSSTGQWVLTCAMSNALVQFGGLAHGTTALLAELFVRGPAPTPTSTSNATVTPFATATLTPGCAPSLFRPLPRTDLAGAPVGEALLTTASEAACRAACCSAPACDGYAFAFTELRWGATASCALYANVTATAPSSFSASGLRVGLALLSLSPSPSASHSGTASPSETPSVARVRTVRLSRQGAPPGTIDYFSLGEVQLWSSGVNVALDGTATASSIWTLGPTFFPPNLIDGILGSTTQEDNYMWHAAGSDAAPWAQITLPQDAVIDRVTVYGRSDCCTYAQSLGATVQLLDASGGVVWTRIVDGYREAPWPKWESAVLPLSRSASRTPSSTPSASSTETAAAAPPSAMQTPLLARTQPRRSASITPTPTASATSCRLCIAPSGIALGSVPSFAAPSCAEVHACGGADGTHWLAPAGVPYQARCTAGATEALRVDGASQSLAYSSPLWINSELFNEEGVAGSASSAAKLRPFVDMPGDSIRVVMTDAAGGVGAPLVLRPGSFNSLRELFSVVGTDMLLQACIAPAPSDGYDLPGSDVTATSFPGGAPACQAACCASAMCTTGWVWVPSAPAHFMSCAEGQPCCYLKGAPVAPSRSDVPGIVCGAVAKLPVAGSFVVSVYRPPLAVCTSPTPSPSTHPYCATTLFRALPRMDLVGTLVGTALSPGTLVTVPSEAACRLACCDAPSCDGFAFTAGDASLAPGGSGLASCFLYANITQLIPSSIVSSGIYESTL